MDFGEGERFVEGLKGALVFLVEIPISDAIPFAEILGSSPQPFHRPPQGGWSASSEGEQQMKS
jgi:hypothetical protein